MVRSFRTLVSRRSVALTEPDLSRLYNGVLTTVAFARFRIHTGTVSGFARATRTFLQIPNARAESRARCDSGGIRGML